jgi:uncharacterized membrane protein YcaP (DUF421 family)
VLDGAEGAVLDGAVLDGALREQRVAPAEVRQAVRGAGEQGMATSVRQVAAVVLETDGTLNVIASSRRGDETPHKPDGG